MPDYLDDRPIKLRRERSGASTPGRTLVFALLLCLMAIGLIVVDYQGFLRPVRMLLLQVLTPVAQPLTAARHTVEGWLAQPQSVQELQARIAELERENADLQAEVLQLEQARIENTYLRQELEIERRQPFTVIGAEVTLRSPDAGRRVMTIAGGREQGIQVGMAVIGEVSGSPASLVGIVEAVGPHTSDVLLITDIGSQVSVRIYSGQSSVLGLMQGQWQQGSRLRVAEIDRDVELHSGDPVVTAGLTAALGLPLDLAIVPPNLPIGTVEVVAFDGQQQIAELRPYVDPDRVSYVWVIRNLDE
jgi:rod shape-determining protein MreC